MKVSWWFISEQAIHMLTSTQLLKWGELRIYEYLTVLLNERVLVAAKSRHKSREYRGGGDFTDHLISFFHVTGRHWGAEKLRDGVQGHEVKKWVDVCA